MSSNTLTKAREKEAREKEASDRKFCKPCINSGSRDDWHLCDYMLQTGHRRGCKAGVGCIRR